MTSPLLRTMATELARVVRESGQKADTERSAASKRELYYNDPVAFCAAAFYADPVKKTGDFVLWEKQADVARAIATKPKTATKSGHKVGKSRLLAAIAWWWASTRANGRVICTSSTDRQVRGIIWHEIKKLWRARKPGFDFPQPAELPHIGVRWKDGREILGFTARDQEAMAGYSGDELLFLCDEASGIPDALFDAIEGNLAGGARIALFSNPTQTTGYFFDAFGRARHEFKTFTIKSTDTPNAKTGKRVVPGLATKEWCEGRARTWGAESARYKVRVSGEFPDQGDDSVVPRNLVEAAMQRWDETEAKGPIVGAIDVARFGDDESVIGFRQGLKIDELEVHAGIDTVELSRRFVRSAEKRRKGARVVARVDTTGVGGGVADYLRSLEHGWLDVEDVVNSETATDPEEHANRRAELWFSVAPFLEAGGALPNDEELDLELGAPKYRFNPRNQMLVESKDEIRKRLGRSPDRADCVTMLTWKATDDAEEGDGAWFGDDDGGSSDTDYRWGEGGRGY